MRPTRPLIGFLFAAAAAGTACGSRDVAPTRDGTAGAVAEIASPAGPSTAQPAMTSGIGPPIFSWVELSADGGGTFRFASWEGGGFGTARTIVAEPRFVRDAADVPSVRRLADGTLFAHWGLKNAGDAHAHDLYAAVSRDEGTTWSTAVRPHRDGAAVEHGFASVVPDAAGPGAAVLWLDGRNAAASPAGAAATGLYMARWDGATFGPERLLDPRVCDCCRTAAVSVPGGFLAAYRDRSPDEVRDISVMSGSADSVSAPRELRPDGWTIHACPTNGPALARTAAGDGVVAAWFTAAGGAPAVWAAVSRDRGISFAPPVRVHSGTPIGRADAASGSAGAALVWLEKSGPGAEVRARFVGSEGALGASVVVATTRAAKGVGVPRAAYAPDGRDLLVAWTDPGPPSRVRVASVVLPR